MADRDQAERPTLDGIAIDEIDAVLAVLENLAADEPADPHGDGLADWARQAPSEPASVGHRAMDGDRQASTDRPLTDPPKAGQTTTVASLTSENGHDFVEIGDRRSVWVGGNGPDDLIGHSGKDNEEQTASDQAPDHDQTVVIIDKPPPELAQSAVAPVEATADPFADTQPLAALDDADPLADTARLAALDDADPEDDVEPAAPPIPSGRTEPCWLELRTIPPLSQPAIISDDDDWGLPLPPATLPDSLDLLTGLMDEPTAVDLARTAMDKLEASNGPTDLPDLTDCAVMIEDGPEETIEVTDEMVEFFAGRPPLPAALIN